MKGRHRIRSGDLIQVWATRIFIWLFLVVALFPCVWVLAVSFRSGDAFYSDEIWPRVLTWKNYATLLLKTDFPLWVYNTLKVAAAVSAIQFGLTSTAAYAFSRLRFRGRVAGLMALVVFQMFPATMVLAANYVLLGRLHLLNTHTGYILISSGAGAYAIWLLKGYIDNIPIALDEAAAVDGATHWQIFTKIILPLSRPFIAVQVLFTVLGMFSEFMSASIFLKNPKLYTVAVGMQSYVGGAFQANHWPIFAAGAVLASIPLVTIWMLLQKQLIAGLTRGAVKG